MLVILSNACHPERSEGSKANKTDSSLPLRMTGKSSKGQEDAQKGRRTPGMTEAFRRTDNSRNDIITKDE